MCVYTIVLYYILTHILCENYKLVCAGMKNAESFRGQEEQIFNLVSEAASEQEWHALMKRTLEHAAGKGESLLIVKLMEAVGVARYPGVTAEVHDSIGEALRAAIRGGHLSIIKMMLEHVGKNFDIDSTDGSGETILHVASRHGKKRIVELLLDRGASMVVRDNKDYTPFVLAVMRHRFGATMAFLDAGVDLTSRQGINDTTVVHLAAQSPRGDTRILRTLLEHGADVDAVDNREQTALHFASGVAFSAENMFVLIGAGGNVNAQKAGGGTPLHSAARHLKPVAVDILLRHGALEDLVDKSGKTAADVVGKRVSVGDQNEEDVNRVRQLLASANVDRTWRRRAPLLLCRSRLTDVQLRALRKRRRCSIRHRDQTANWQRVARWLLSPDTPEGIFRSVVTHLW